MDSIYPRKLFFNVDPRRSSATRKGNKKVALMQYAGIILRFQDKIFLVQVSDHDLFRSI